ncbi:DUF5681 domain-containing protein [Methylobacterium sp. NEAU K]|uniref:DUF5681 domain-containing protein n=1 Tax=Methylobacterium sp. NEAU K TaxID=3064946 RepID=UPI002734DD28|nr:DUF5681 domain-containing protein [Methylobacterium sp. NEAU K]MDP4003688.1 DUF5681 domain-containing protein [Methylobacterium sp. NEAU K]
MSDEPIETNDNAVARDDDRASQASSARDEDDAQHQRVRAGGGRFCPGQSGNPRGRPRKQPEPVIAMMTRVLNEAVQLNRGGKRVEMPCGEAIFRALCHRAMTDPRLGKDVFRLVAAREAMADAGEMDARLAQSESAFDHHLARMRRQIIAELSAASAAGSGAGDNDNPGPASDPERAP